MLLDLHIRDFVLITQLHLAWESGLTALTGETGAGKSILLDALGTLLGGKVAAADIVRAGADSALIEAAFAPVPAACAILEELGISTDDDCIVLSREISRSGRSRCRINGQIANISALQRLGSVLVDIHSQHEAQWLMSPARQLDMLDAFGGSDLGNLRRQVAELARQRQAARREYEVLVAGERDRARQLDILQYQVDEIAAANLQEGEDQALEEERAILANAEHLDAQLALAYQALYENEDGAAVDLVGRAVASLAEAARFDPRSEELLTHLRDVEANLADYAREVRLRREEIRANPERLAEVEARLDCIDRLKRKYGQDVAEVLRFVQTAEVEIAQLSAGESRTEELAGQIAALDKQLLDLADQLHTARLTIARNLEQKVEAELRLLSMERASFRIAMQRREAADGIASAGVRLAITERGYDTCEFLFSANPGEEPRPLAKVASGGELSRVMLALKAALAAVYDVPTLIFDEVDAGLGGRTAQAVAQKLRVLAATRQVICVTHLAQIAAAADQHILIDKVVEGDSTRVVLHTLTMATRVNELARMLDGTSSAATLEHAREMLASTQKAPS